MTETIDAENHNMFLVPGLGADHRVFVNFRMSGYKERHLRWLKPEDKRENIEHYAERMCEKIASIPGPKSVLGLSFGGMMAIEMAKHLDFENVILVSSIKHANEMPQSFATFKAAGVHNWFPTGSLRYSGFIVSRLFGTENPEERQFLSKMLKKINPALVKWSMRKVVEWENEWYPEDIIHVHGTRDQVFPAKYLGEHISVRGGTHVMIANRSELVEGIIHKAIEEKWQEKSSLEEASQE